MTAAVASAKAATGVGSGSSSSQPQASIAATKPESRRGRFEVYPEQALSLSDWTTLPKAPAGFVEASRIQFVKNTLITSRDRLNRNDRNTNYDRERSHDRHDRENDRNNSSSRPRVASSASMSSISTHRNKSFIASSQSGASTPQVVPGSLLHSMAPEAAQQYVKQYMLALTALNQMRNSVAGLAQGLGLKGGGGVINITEEDSSASLGTETSASIHSHGHSSAPSQHQQGHTHQTQHNPAVLSQSTTTTAIAAAPPLAPTVTSLAPSSASSANQTDAERLKAEVERLDRNRRTLLLDKKKLEEDVDEKNKMITILKQKLAKAQLLAK